MHLDTYCVKIHNKRKFNLNRLIFGIEKVHTWFPIYFHGIQLCSVNSLHLGQVGRRVERWAMDPNIITMC